MLSNLFVAFRRKCDEGEKSHWQLSLCSRTIKKVVTYILTVILLL